MKFSELQNKLKAGDKIVNTIYIKRSIYEIYRGNERMFTINYSQFKKLTNGLIGKVYAYGFTKQVYIYE